MIPTTRTFVLLGLASLLVVFGFVTPWIGWVGLGFNLLIIGLAVMDGRRAARSPLTLSRELPGTLHQAESAELLLLLRTDSARPLRLWIREVLAPELLAEPTDLRLELPARGSATAHIQLVPRLRGFVRLAPAAVRIEGPWRLAWHTRSLAPAGEARIYPRLHLERDAALLLKRALSTRMGANPIAARGLSTEVYALREYRAGDPLRSLHWKASARLNRPITRELAWEQHQHTLVLLDCGRPMAGLAGVPGQPLLSKLDHAMSAVIALLRAIVAQQDSATLVLFSKEVRATIAVDRRTRSFRQVFEQLHDVAADLDEPDYDGVAAWCARRVPRRSLSVVLSSVVDLAVAEPLGEGLVALSRRHSPLLVNLLDPDLARIAASVPEDPAGAFAKASAMRMLETNEALGRRLRGRGIDTLTTPADRLALSMLQRYLDLKARRRA